MGGSSGGGSQTIQKADPWSGVQPYLLGLYQTANRLANDNSPKVAQNSGIADFTPQAEQALGAIEQRAQGSYGDKTLANNAAAMSNGNDIISQYLASMAQGKDAGSQAAQSVINGNTDATKVLSSLANGNDASSQYLKSVLSGQFLNPSSNPYLSGAVDAANADVTRQFNTAVMPQLASQFSLAGRYGSGAQSQGISDATNNLAQVLTNNASSIYNQNYQNERGLQQAASGLLSGIQSNAAGTLGGLQNTAAGTLSTNLNNGAQGLSNRSIAGTQLLGTANQVDWNNLNQGLNAASIRQQQAQNQYEGWNNVYNANQQQPYNQIQWLSQILGGTAGLGGQSTSSQSTSGAGVRNAFGGALGGAATGAAIGSAVPGIGTALGAGIGGLGGLLMGVL